MRAALSTEQDPVSTSTSKENEYPTSGPHSWLVPFSSGLYSVSAGANDLSQMCCVAVQTFQARASLPPPPPSEALPGLTQVPEASWIEASASQALQASATSLGLYGSPLPPLALSGIFP